MCSGEPTDTHFLRMAPYYTGLYLSRNSPVRTTLKRSDSRNVSGFPEASGLTRDRPILPYSC